MSRALAGFATAAAMALLALLGGVGGARAQVTPPDVLVKNVTLEVVDIIARDKEIQAGDRKKVIALIEAKVVPHFNFDAMTASAVGRSWEKANAEQKVRLTDEFRALLVRTYASAIAAYSGQKLEFRPLRAKPTDTDVTVNVRVLQPGAQPVQIDYDMEKRPTGWKVWDVRVAGISLVANYRTEFDNQVRQAGIEGLIRTLQQKNKSLARASVAGAEKK
ncbi:MAG: MlaC/ttg2D family ABC transporter substrate-binding protein [Burkholderiales bacterium]